MFFFGAKDYIAKPFYMEELIVRIENILTQNNSYSKIKILKTKDLIINYDTFSVYAGDHLLDITRTEFEIIKLLSLNLIFYFSKDQIYDSINFNKIGNTQVVSEHIRK